MKHVRIDDGTLDTVVQCTACGEETRYAFAGYACCDTEVSYDTFVAECLDDAEASHECPEEEEEA